MSQSRCIRECKFWNRYNRTDFLIPNQTYSKNNLLSTSTEIERVNEYLLRPVTMGVKITGTLMSMAEPPEEAY